MALLKCLSTAPGKPPLHIDMTAQEEAAHLAQQEIDDNDPKNALRLLARKLSGAEENVYTNLIAAGVLTRAGLPVETLEALNARRGLDGKAPL